MSPSIRGPEKIFIDTSAFFALQVAEDENHERACALFEAASRERARTVTTNAVLFETHALLVNRARDGRRAGLRFLDAARASALRVVRVAARDEASAESILRAHEDKAFSLCDSLSFAVMERLGIERAISFDRHFRAVGRFTILGS